MGRRRKKQITYDSRETRTLLGLLALLAALVLFISALVDPAERNLFTEIRVLFGQTTLMAAVFSFNLALMLLGTRFPFTTRVSVIAQFVLVLLLPAFFSSFYRSEVEAFAAAELGLSGGRIGYELAFNFLADGLVFGQFTPLILGIAVLIFIPITLSMSVSRVVEIVGGILGWSSNATKTLFAHREKEDADTNKLPEKAVRFGDFQREVKPALKPQIPERIAVQPSANKQPELHEVASQTQVEIKEQTIGEEGLSQGELKYPKWQLPPVSLLAPYKKVKPKDADTERNARIIEQTLASFSVDATVAEAYVGPSVVRYALNIPLGTKVDKITTLAPTLALGLGVDSKAIRVDNIVGTTFLGIEVPRQQRDFVQIREIMESAAMQEGRFMLPVPVGKDIDGDCVLADIQKMPHLLIAGATGSGKSVLTNSFIMSMLMNRTPDELRLVLVDPKQVELMDYNGIPHLLVPVIVDMSKVVNVLNNMVAEMELRYTILAGNQVRNIEEYNKKKGFAAMPYIVIVIDEMADMMMTADRNAAENAIVRLTQKARAVGIHLVLATQRPSVNVITGLIKANVPARIGMSVASAVDSRVILDAQGAESLMGKGDLLYNSPGVARMMRLQGPSVSGEEIMRVVNFIKAQAPEAHYIMELLEQKSTGAEGGEGDLGDVSGDDMFAAAVKVVVASQKGSASYLQRRLGVGFNRAARLLEEMEELGVVGPQIGSKPREVMISDAEDFLAKLRQGTAG
jgi:DNA segregation ATPase FtsK/SpoIIIE-like protein